jgi:ribosomal protein S18 acetylase RimI-like enzyme
MKTPPDIRPDIAVRPATTADMSAVGKLGAALVALHHGFDTRRFIPATPETERIYASFLGSQLGQENVVILVADAAGQVIGYTYSGLEGHDYKLLRGPAGVIYDLMVDPERRREGIGGLLLAATRAALLERGAPQIVLSTAEGNHLAQDFFAAAGFRRTMVEMTWEPAG